MGWLDAVAKRLRRATGDGGDKPAANAPWGGRAPDKADYGRAGAPTPDMDALVTDAEIATVAGAAPVGEPRRNGPDGSEVDLGRRVIRESKLANGDTFLLSLGNCANAAAAQLAMNRLADDEQELAGVGERALVRIKTYPKKGTSELGVTALSGNFTVSLVHTSTTGNTDPEPLTRLLRQVLTRL